MQISGEPLKASAAAMNAQLKADQRPLMISGKKPLNAKRKKQPLMVSGAPLVNTISGRPLMISGKVR